MTHDITNAAYSRTAAWHGLGTVVPRDMVADEAFALCGLDWTVSKRPLYSPTYHGGDPNDVRHVQVPGRFGVVRDDTQAVLGVCSARYEPVQNRQILDLARHVETLDAGASVESALELSGGRDVAMLVKLREWTIGGHGQDPSADYLLLWNSHDGGTAVTLVPTSIRVVCRNTLRMATSGTNLVRIRHTAAVHRQLDSVMGALSKAYDASCRWEEDANRLSAWRPSGADVVRLLQRAADVVLGDPERDERGIMLPEVRDKRDTLIDAMEKATEFGARDAHSMDTAWDLFNRVTGHIQHRRGHRRTQKARAVDPTSRDLTRKDQIRRSFMAALAD